MEAPKKQGRCPDCGYRLRGKGHELGPHHNGGRIGEKVMAGKRTAKVKRTAPASKGHGFDFSAIKRSGVR